MTGNENKTAVQQDSILFVDDEKNILQSIKRTFYDNDIDVYTANNAQEALEILKSTKVKIVVSDYRMPTIDGMQFLQMVKMKYPAIYRIIFSGFIDNKLLRRALGAGWATAYFTKPWDNMLLKKRITHILKLINLMGDDLFKTLNMADNLPSPIPLLNEFNNTMAHDRSKEEIIEVITHIPPLVLKIFQISNALFVDTTEICTVLKAVDTLKFAGLKDIALHLDFTALSDWDNVRLVELWYLCFESVLINRYLPDFYFHLTGEKLPSLFSALGFAVNAGKILVIKYFPLKYKKIKEYQTENKNASFYESEIACGFVGINSSKLGSYHLSLWNLPQLFVHTVRFLHRPEKAPEKIRDVLKVIYYMESLISRLFYEKSSDDLHYSSLYFKNIPENKIKKIMSALSEEFKEFEKTVHRIKL